MQSIKYLACFFFLLLNSQILSQEKKILVFDPNDVSQSFQSSFSQLSDDSIFVADTIDENINDFDALFLFIEYPYILSQNEGNHLIYYLNLDKPIYLSTNLWFQKIDSVLFWNHIGIDFYADLLTQVHVNYVVGIDSEFTKGIYIDTSFISSGIPYIDSSVVPILDGIEDTLSLKINTTFIPEDNSLNVIIDLYRMIDHIEFLEKVIEQFGLKASPIITVTSPNGGELWLMGDLHNITWSSNKIDSVKIELSLHDGLLWHTITESTASDGIYEWVVQAPQTSLECRIKIADLIDTTVSDCSDTTFVIDMFPSVDDSTNSIIPAEFALMQNYPNPFNPATTIKFRISESEFVNLKVFDVLANEVATLVDEEKHAGTYEVEFDGTELPSGLYFYQLKAGSFVETKKMVLIK